MRINTRKLKKYLLPNIPYIIFAYAGDKFACAYRLAEGKTFGDKLLPMLTNLADVFAQPLPSFHPMDLLIGLLFAAVMKFIMYIKAKNRKKYRTGREYGSAEWGAEKAIEPFMDQKDFENNIILTRTEFLSLGRPAHPKYARNKNILVIGGSGSGKTRFFVKPNLMQMHSSYIVTDPKGTVLVECGRMLQRGRPTGRKNKNGKMIYEPYRIKVFNTIDFTKSMHYNPFSYISAEHREKDIIKFVEVLIKNTNGNKPSGGDDFWEKAEKLLYMAYIAMIFTFYPEEERNFETLIDMINASECREDEEDFKNAMDVQFEFLECWINDEFPDDSEHTESSDHATDDPEQENSPKEHFSEYYQEIRKNCRPTKEQVRLGTFAIKQYKSYKLAAGKTAKSILISCSTRLAPFAIDEVLEITSHDELGLDKMGDELSALFIIISDTDTTFNFLVAMMYSQLFNLLCTRADTSPGGRLKYHVRCLLDEFANIGEIPNFDKLIATIRSREISASIILQAKSQLKAIYKDNADTIEGNCDTLLFLGGTEKTTLKELSEMLGKETIDSMTTSQNRGQSESYGTNYQKVGKELMAQDEIAVMDGGKCILRVRGVRPFFSDKFDITSHRQYEMLLDKNPDMEFDIAKFIKERRDHKSNLSKDDMVEQHECNGQIPEETVVSEENGVYSKEEPGSNAVPEPETDDSPDIPEFDQSDDDLE